MEKNSACDVSMSDNIGGNEIFDLNPLRKEELSNS